MSIQRYSFTAQRRLECHKEDEGDYVLYTDHLTDKEAELYNFLSTLSDIRAALGVGDKPMLSELAGEAGRIKRERDEVVEALRPFAGLDMSPYEGARGERTFYQLNETKITVGDIRKARAVLAKIEGIDILPGLKAEEDVKNALNVDGACALLKSMSAEEGW